MTPSSAFSSAPPPASFAAPTDAAARFGRPTEPWRSRAFAVIFESDSRAGRLFDLVLIAAILASVLIVILDSVQSISARREKLFDAIEWGFTLLFTVEYVLRLLCVRHPLRYATSGRQVADDARGRTFVAHDVRDFDSGSHRDCCRDSGNSLGAQSMRSQVN